MDGKRLDEERDLREWLGALGESGCQWDAPHLQVIQHELGRVTAGRCDRLMLFLPPRHGKSELVTVRYPVFRLQRRPELRVIIGAYNQALAERFSRKARRIAAARFALSRDRNTAWEWETQAGGGVRAVGVGGGVTGLGADLILIDDPVKSREEAESRTYRDRVWDWYRDDLYTRQEPGCAVILVMTRWHEDDLAGRILASEEAGAWRVVRLPALAESEAEYRAWAEMQRERRSVKGAGWDPEDLESAWPASLSPPQLSLSDPLGRAEGEPLWPSRFPAPALHRIRTALGSRSFAALYQGRPLPAEGGLFRREWFRIVEVLPEAGREVDPPSVGASEETASLPVPELPEDATPLERMRHARALARGEFNPVPCPVPELPPDATPLEREQLRRAVARGDYDPVPRLVPRRERDEYESRARRRLEALAASQAAVVSPCSEIRWVRFWDTAAKAGQRSDYWAGALLVRMPEGDWYLVDLVRGRWEYPEAKRRVLQTAAADGAGVPVVIEESASGIALLQDLAADPRADGYWIRAEKVVADKEVRAGAWASAAEMGRFHLVRGAWNAAFLAEVEAFPYGAHDDQVDAVSGAYACLFRQSRRPRWFAFAGRAR